MGLASGERRLQQLGEGQERRCVGVGRAPAVVAAEVDEPVDEDLQAGVLGVRSRQAPGHLGDRPRLTGEDEPVAGVCRRLQPAVRLAALPQPHDDAVPQASGELLARRRGNVAVAGERLQDAGDRLEVEELRLPRQLRGVARVELPGLGERHQCPAPFGERLAVDEAGVVGAQRLLEAVGQRVEELGIDPVAGILRLDQELHDPRGERDVACGAGPVRREARAVHHARDPLEGLANGPVEILVGAALLQQGAELLEGELSAGAADPLLGAAVRVGEQEVQPGGHAHESGLVGDEDRPPHAAGPGFLGDRWNGERLSCFDFCQLA